MNDSQADGFNVTTINMNAIVHIGQYRSDVIDAIHNFNCHQDAIYGQLSKMF